MSPDGREELLELIAARLCELKSINEAIVLRPERAWLFSLQFSYILHDVLVYVDHYAIAPSKEVTPADREFISETFRQFSERYSDYVLGSSEQFLAKFAARRGGVKGAPSDSVSERNRYWAIAAARALSKIDAVVGKKTNYYELAAKAVSKSEAPKTITGRGLKAWLQYRKRLAGRPDAPAHRARLFVVETRWVKSDHGIKGPGWSRDSAEATLRRVERGVGYFTVGEKTDESPCRL